MTEIKHMPPLILVTGATGYIASRLIPQLLDRGYQIRALARQPQRLKNKSWFSQVEVTQGDVMDANTLTSAFEDVQTAYYLIHNMSSGHGYTERELEGARNFARAAESAGVQHIIYLGGLADEEQHIAPHMRSRIETGATLRQGKVPVTEFRAGVVAGSGSISFEMIRFMTELFPIIPAPFWVKNKSQPISTQNVIDYLLAALDNHGGQGQVFEIGGPHVTTYQELMLSYARTRGLKRRFFLLPYVPVWFMAFGIGLTTPVPSPIAYALVGGLSSDSVVMHDDARRVYPEVNLIDFESAAKEALTRLHPHRIERIWDDRDGRKKSLRHEGFFIDHREIKADTTPEKMFAAVKKHDGRFTIETVGENQILAHLKMKVPGQLWVEWKKGRTSNFLAQTVFFTPRGLGGFLFWYLLRPVSIPVFNRWLKNIAHDSVVK
jgi:uncharacterized protein YbjT (DUF2867 family)